MPEVVEELDLIQWGANITNKDNNAVSVTFQRHKGNQSKHRP